MPQTLQDVLDRVALTVAFSDIEDLTVTTKGIFGDVPIHAVAGWGDKEGVEILLIHGADINAVGDHGETPIYFALISGNEEFLRFMVERGALLDIKNDCGDTPEDLARVLGRADIADFLAGLRAGSGGPA